MLALAIILGCNPIYITGVDLDYSRGYVKPGVTNNDNFNLYFDRIIKDFYIINKSAKKKGVEIFSIGKDIPINKSIEYKELKL